MLLVPASPLGFPLWRGSSLSPRLRLSALTRGGHFARLSRSPSLASAGCALPLRGRLPAVSDGVRCGTVVRGRKSGPSSSPPTWGAHNGILRAWPKVVRFSGWLPLPAAQALALSKSPT